MTDEHDTIDRGIRSIEIVDSAGAHRRHLRVFCPVESRSLDPRTCARCDLCASFPADLEADGAQLRCRVPRRTDPAHAAGWFVGSGAVSSWLPAGVVVPPVGVCARFDAPMSAVGEALVRNAVGTAIVVDERTRVLGVVSQSELTARETTPVLAAVDADVTQVQEGGPLAEVIARMAYRRAHRVVVIQSDGRVAGLVSELDVLRWVAAGGSSW